MVTAAVSLLKRLPPKQIAKTLAGVVNLVDDPDIQQDVMDKITSTLELSEDDTGRMFV